jgi:hypothetical protein
LSFYVGVGVGDLKTEESELEVLYTNSIALPTRQEKEAYLCRSYLSTAQKRLEK